MIPLLPLLLPRLAQAEPLPVDQVSVATPGACIEVATLSYVMPAPFFEEALVKAKTLEATEVALHACTHQSTEALDAASVSLAECSAGLRSAGTTTGRLEATSAVLEAQLRDVRRQRNIAFGVTGALLLGAGAALALR